MSSPRDLDATTSTDAPTADARPAVLDRRRFVIVALATLAVGTVAARAEAAPGTVHTHASPGTAPPGVLAQRMGGGMPTPAPAPAPAPATEHSSGASPQRAATAAPASTRHRHRVVRRPVMDEGSRMKK
jgi:hypothetical protein